MSDSCIVRARPRRRPRGKDAPFDFEDEDEHDDEDECMAGIHSRLRLLTAKHKFRSAQWLTLANDKRRMHIRSSLLHLSSVICLLSSEKLYLKPFKINFR